jgi:glucosylceramidase
MGLKSRREFLSQAAGAAAASLLCAKKGFAWSVPGASSAARAWVTTDEAKFQSANAGEWREPRGQVALEIDPSRHLQSILGFGGAFTDASCYLLGQMASDQRTKLIDELVGPDGLRLSLGRTCMGASDYSRNVYSYDDSATPDPELKNFSTAHDEAYILPVLRAAQKANPEMFYFSTPWSPPGWMKAGGSMLGGSMRKKYFDAYAEYFVRFLENYRDAGVKVSAVTSQNETDTDQDGRMPAALWGQEYEMAFVSQHLAPALQRAGLDTKIWILDHNYNLWGRAVDELEDPDVFKVVDGVAWHGYMGDASAMTRVHNAFPTKNAYWTEGGPDISDPNYAKDWAKWSSGFARILKNWARCIVSWNLVLDEKGQPDIGPFSCGGLVTVDSKSGVITRSGQYWAFAHYSRVVRRGARVIASTGEIAGADHVAFQNPDGSLVLVLGNEGQARRIVVGCAGKALDLEVPANSALTLTWGAA